MDVGGRRIVCCACCYSLLARTLPLPPAPSQPPTSLTCSQAAQLQAWLPPGGAPSPGAWKEVYRGTTHGFGAAAFHSRCDGRPRLLVLVRSREPEGGGWLFGGFTAVGFSPPADGGNAWIRDPDAFLFSLANRDTPLGRSERLASLRTGDDLFYAARASASFGDGCGLHVCGDADRVAGSYTRTGLAYAESASVGAHPMAQGRQAGWRAKEVVAWAV